MAEAGGGIGNVPPGFMESAMGNRELEELWAEKEQRREEKVNSNWRRKSLGVKCWDVERF